MIQTYLEPHQVRLHLLGLPIELRCEMFSYLLRPLSTQSWEDGVNLGLSLSILRVCRQTYHEGSHVFRKNGLVKLHYSGPSTYAPNRGFLRVCSIDSESFMRAGNTICTIQVVVRKAKEFPDIHTCAILNLSTLLLFLSRLRARQIVSVPTTIIQRRLPENETASIRMQIDMNISFPTSSLVDLSHKHCGEYRSQLISEEKAIYDLVRQFQHPDNKLVIAPRSSHWDASMITMNCPLPWRWLKEWIPYALGISLTRRQEIDSAYSQKIRSHALVHQYAATEYRNLCLDLHFFIERCRSAHLDESTEALGKDRTQIFTLFCSTFLCYATIQTRYGTIHGETWPIRRPCSVEICACHVLVHTKAKIDADRPSPDLGIPITMWRAMQHFAIVTHYLADRSEEAAKRAMHRLQLLHRKAPGDSYVSHDIDVLKEVVQQGPWVDERKQLSLFTFPPRLFGEDGLVLRVD